MHYQTTGDYHIEVIEEDGGIIVIHTDKEDITLDDLNVKIDPERWMLQL